MLLKIILARISTAEKNMSFEVIAAQRRRKQKVGFEIIVLWRNFIVKEKKVLKFL